MCVCVFRVGLPETLSCHLGRVSIEKEVGNLKGTTWLNKFFKNEENIIKLSCRNAQWHSPPGSQLPPCLWTPCQNLMSPHVNVSRSTTAWKTWVVLAETHISWTVVLTESLLKEQYRNRTVMCALQEIWKQKRLHCQVTNSESWFLSYCLLIKYSRRWMDGGMATYTVTYTLLLWYRLWYIFTDAAEGKMFQHVLQMTFLSAP